MGPTRIVILLVAAVAAIGLAVVARSFFNRPAPAPVVATAPPVAAGKPVVQVLTAKHDLVIGERLTADDLTWTAWPVEAVNPAFITDGAAPAPAAEKSGGEKLAKAAGDAAASVIGGAGPMKQFEGAIVREPMLTGEPVMDRKVVRGGEGGYMSVVLAAGHRAVSIPITVETGAGGFILPGDRVDVLQSREVNTPAAAMNQAVSKNTFVADTVLSNIRVLAVDQNIEAPKDAKSLVGATATLEVTPADAELLMRAKAQGTLQLSLRAYTDVGAPSGATRREANLAASNVVRIHRGGPVASEPVTP